MTATAGNPTFEHIAAQMIEAGIETPPQRFITDGHTHHFSSTAARKKETGWYVIHDDPAGAVWVFGDFRLGIKLKGNGAAGRTYTRKELEARDKKHRALNVKIKHETERFYAGAATEAQQ